MFQFLSPRQYYNLYGVKPRKRFGQHFLAQPSTAKHLVKCADLKHSDIAVEVGPGLGALTQFILPVVDTLHLVELDRDLAEYLSALTDSVERDVQLHQQDILRFDFQALSRSGGKRLIILGSLPYNITSPLIFHLLESRECIKRAVFMVQKEVGERLAASPGSKSYGVLSVLLGVYSNVTKLFTVGPEQFYPRPQVDSLVIRIDFAEELVTAPSFKFFRTVVNVAFQQRRKTLHNSLKSLIGEGPGRLEQAFADSGIDPMRRPETLTPKEFLRLVTCLEASVQ
jgi:16S rRNA (adenine1518-N6/adenine1519-N6)-dimethyltransferase